MLKSICFFILMFIFSFAGFAQDTIRREVFPFDTLPFKNVPTDTIIKAFEEPVEESQIQKPIESKIYYGGFVNLTFGSYTVIGVEPMLAYKFTPRLSVGTKLTYEYIHEKQGSYNYEESNYGFSLFTRMRVTQRLYTHVEYSSMNYKFYDELGESERKWVPFLFCKELCQINLKHLLCFYLLSSEPDCASTTAMATMFTISRTELSRCKI